MKLTTYITVFGIAAAMFTGAAQADSGDADRAGHVRTVGGPAAKLHERRNLETPAAHTATPPQRWVPYRSPYARPIRRHHSEPFLYTYVVPFRHELACRYLADCPCRYLAGC